MDTNRTTSLVVAAGLVGGFAVARVTKVRMLGGIVLSLAGAQASRDWAKDGAITATALGSIYTTAFALSHPLAKKIGAWPAVFVVASSAAAAAWLLHDRKA